LFFANFAEISLRACGKKALNRKARKGIAKGAEKNWPLPKRCPA
jgi:hypothetical protein